MPHEGRFYRALAEVKVDLPIAEFLETHFADRRYDELRRSITRTVEGYDAGDPRLASTLALRDEWMAPDDGEHGRLAEGYGALVEYLSSECRRHGAALYLGTVVGAIDQTSRRVAVDRLVRWTQGQQGIVILRGRTHRHGACLARRDFRLTSGPHQEESCRVTGHQLGQRSVRARRLFLRHA